MRLGISPSLPHSDPEKWADLHKAAGLDAVVFPADWKAEVSLIDRYRKAAEDRDIKIAEVGAWCNPFDPDENRRRESRENCLRSLELAEYVGASCCVNISGAAGEIWDGSYPGNYSPEMYEDLVLFLQDLLDRVRPVKTKYALESMPHMLPDSPSSYLDLLRDVDRPGFGVHVDIVNMLVSPRVYFENRKLIRETFGLLGPYIRSCHLKDAILDHGLTVSIRETECGTGGLDIAYYISEADRVDPEMPMIIEHLPDLESYRRAIRYIKGLYPKK